MEREIIKYIETELLTGQKKTTVSEETDLLSSGLIESTSMMKLIAHLESEYDVHIPYEDMIIENFMTVRDMARYLGEKKGL